MFSQIDDPKMATRWLWIGLFLLLMFRMLFLYIDQRPLNTDEAQYWLWSQHFAWGYHSKPPLIALAIKLSTKLFSNNYFGVRFFSTFSYFVTTIFMYLAAKQLFNRRVAVWVALSFFLTPAVAYSSTIISTDPLMLMFWSVGFYFCVLALQNKRNSWYWMSTGFCVGLSVLSKYTGLVFYLSLFLFFIFDKSQRGLLKTTKPYIALLATCLVMAPNIYWNLSNHFAAINHVIYHNANIGGFHLHLTPLLMFLASQFIVFSLIYFPILIFLFFQRKAINTDWKRNLLYFFAAPMLFIIIVEAILSRAYANWAAATYLAGTILVVEYLFAKNKINLLKLNVILSVVLMMIFYFGEFLMVEKGEWRQFQLLYYDKVMNWQRIATPLRKLKSEYPHANFLFTNRSLWSKGVYYGRLPLSQVYVWGNQFDVTQPLTAGKNQNFIYLNKYGFLPKPIKNSFESWQLLPTIKLDFNHHPLDLTVFYLHKFKPDAAKQ